MLEDAQGFANLESLGIGLYIGVQRIKCRFSYTGPLQIELLLSDYVIFLSINNYLGTREKQLQMVELSASNDANFGCNF